MRSKLHLRIAFGGLIAGLLFSACTPVAQPIENGTQPAAAPPTSAASTSAVEQPPAAESPTAGAPETAAAGCPLAGEPRYVNSQYGYCFNYPEGFTLREEGLPGPAISGPALEDSPEPLRATLNIYARPVPQGADLGGLVSGFLSQSPFSEPPTPVGRTAATLGGEPAEVMEPVPGLLSSRVVLAVHGGTAYLLYFNPTDMEQAQADLETLYETVMSSFTFFPVEEQPQAQPETVTYFEFGRTFSFAYDPSLALTVEPMTVEAVQPSPEAMVYDAHPAYVQFRFLGYNGGRLAQLPYPFETAKLMAFQTQDFAGFSADQTMGFPQQLEDLRSLLEIQPDLAERCTGAEPVSGQHHLPFLPWLNSAQVFCAQPQYIEFNGGKGIRYLTAFSQGAGPLVDPFIFYTFQGLSDDGEIYFSGVFPVFTGIFPLEIAPGVYGEGTPPPPAVTAEQLNAMNAQAGDLFQPALGQLDALVSSLKAEKAGG